MIDWISDNPWVVWVGIAVVLAVAELLSLELVLLMFGIAALVAAVVSLFAPAWVAILVFGLVSVLLLGVIRPRFVRRLHSGPTLTVGHHNLVGRPGVVDEPVSSSAGRVVVEGDLWTARSPQGEHYDVGAEVVVVAIEGATAMVTGKALH